MTSLPCLQSVSLSYLLTAYLIQGISSLLQALLTFRQAGPFQRELLAHVWGDNLVGSETSSPPSFLKLFLLSLFYSSVCLSLCAHVCFISSPSLSCHASLSTCLYFTFDVYLHVYLLPRRPVCFLFCALVFLNFPSLCSMSSVNTWYQVVQQGR